MCFYRLKFYFRCLFIHITITPVIINYCYYCILLLVLLHLIIFVVVVVIIIIIISSSVAQ